MKYSSKERAQILLDISKNPYISQREIANKNRISLGKVNYAIRALIDKGLIKIHNFKGSQNKKKYMYLLTPSGVYEKAKQTSEYFKWKMEEYERLKQEIRELEEDMKRSTEQGESDHDQNRDKSVIDITRP